MSNALSELFDKILTSEQKFHDRITQIKSLNTETHEQQKQYQILVEEVETLTKSVETTRKQLEEFQLDAKCGVARQTAMHEQLKRLREEEKRTAAKLTEVEERKRQERLHMLNKMSNFCQRYDLTGDGKVQLDNQSKLRIEVLEKELKNCDGDVSAVTEKVTEVSNMKDVITLTEAEIDETEKLKKQLVDELEEIEREIKLAERHRFTVSSRPHDDREFQMIQAELEACKDNAMEAMCTALAEELRELQRSRQTSQRTRRQQKGRNGPRQPAIYSKSDQTRQTVRPTLTQQTDKPRSRSPCSHNDLLNDVEWACEIDDTDILSPSSASQLTQLNRTESSRTNPTNPRQRVDVSTSNTVGLTGSRKRVRFQY